MPSWFAEYCLYLAIYAVLISIGMGAYGVVVLIGLIPKLMYVGARPIQAAFFVADLVLLGVAVFVAVRGWNLLKATRSAAPALTSASRG